MLSLYEILKASKTGIAPDMWTALAGKNWGGADSGHEVKELTGIPPLSFKSDGTPLLDWYIKGNTVQNGTPSPSSPVDVNGVGDIINLFDKTAIDTTNGYVDACYLRNDGSENPQTAYFISEYIGVAETATYTLLYGTTAGNIALCYYDSNKDYISGVKYGSRLPFIFTTPANARYIRFSAIKYSNIKDIITLNKGSEALPYVAYGQYGIPISNGTTTTIVSLGESQSTRAVKKLVFDGTENWKLSSTANQFYIDSALDAIPQVDPMCTHFKGVSSLSADNQIVISTSQKINIRTTYIQHNLTDWIDYLQQQYANGTPVIVWYVLATPQTAVVNEPLRKIGNYADTLSMEQAGISIPTVSGTNVIDVETTLKPSEMYIKYQE